MRILLLSLLVAAPALAAPPPCATEHEGEYRDGIKRLDGGDAPGAVEKLSALRMACPAPAIDFYLAVAHEKMGRLRMALDALEKYLAAAGAADNRGAVEAWGRELSARADAEKQGVPPPVAPPRAPPGPPPPYLAAEAPKGAAKAGPKEFGAEDRWLAFAAIGLAGNGALQPGTLSSHAGTVGELGVAYQLGVGYRIALGVPLDLEAMITGQLLPWIRSDLPALRSTVFVTLIGVGLRLELPVVRGARARLVLCPSLAGGLGSYSVDTDPIYKNGLAVRGGLGVAVDRGAVGAFIEPELLLLVGGDLAGPQWTAGVTAGARVRF